MSWQRNGNLGRFTNFVNLQDMCGIAVPSGILRGERCNICGRPYTSKPSGPLDVLFYGHSVHLWCDTHVGPTWFLTVHVKFWAQHERMSHFANLAEGHSAFA